MGIYAPNQTVWSTYTPAWTSAGTAPAIGNATVSGRYVQFGKTVTVTVNVTFGSTSTFGTGEYLWSLPVNANTTPPYYFGAGWALQTGTAYFSGIAKVTTSSSKVQVHSSASSSNAWGQTIPFTWANTHQFGFTITYEAA